MPDALYADRGDHFESSRLTRGPWDEEHQHAGPPAALLSRAVEQAAGIADGQAARLSFEIFAPVPIAPLQVETSPIRPGKRVELHEATLTPVGAGKPVMQARIWRMAYGQSEPVPAEPEQNWGEPGSGEEGGLEFMGPDPGYQDVLEWRFIEGRFDRPGPATAWTRMRVNMVGDQPASPLQHLLVMADAGNGISMQLDWSKWLFVNVDLTLHLQRPPEGEWIGMQARTRIAETGMGVANTVMFDERGRFGAGAQSLFVAPRT